MKNSKYTPATMDDLKTAKVLYHIHPWFPDVRSEIKLNYKGMNQDQVKAMKQEVMGYLKEGKLYVQSN